jgi:hypothetical protein
MFLAFTCLKPPIIPQQHKVSLINNIPLNAWWTCGWVCIPYKVGCRTDALLSHRLKRSQDRRTRSNYYTANPLILSMKAMIGHGCGLRGRVWHEVTFVIDTPPPRKIQLAQGDLTCMQCNPPLTKWAARGRWTGSNKPLQSVFIRQLCVYPWIAKPSYALWEQLHKWAGHVSMVNTTDPTWKSTSRPKSERC